ncbi:MAG TPA: hypothetical protein VE691_03325 [Rubrobacter sp.]|nr:hypothetical protein [Rubrobacter sp.]
MVSPQRRELLLDAARGLGYMPNALACSLVTRSNCTIGIVASDLSAAELARFAAHPTAGPARATRLVRRRRKVDEGPFIGEE